MAKNTHKVPKKMWGRWSKAQQGAFNNMWFSLNMNFLPTGVVLTRAQFRVLRFNVSCIAAWNAEG